MIIKKEAPFILYGLLHNKFEFMNFAVSFPSLKPYELQFVHECFLSTANNDAVYNSNS